MGLLRFSAEHKAPRIKPFDPNENVWAKKKKGILSSVQSAAGSDTTRGQNTAAEQMPAAPTSPAPPAPAGHSEIPQGKSHSRVRLGCDLNKELHCRLRVHAAKSGRTVVSFIEEWIESNCPAV
jgi:hypothetical protein